MQKKDLLEVPDNSSMQDNDAAQIQKSCNQITIETIGQIKSTVGKSEKIK